MKTNWKRWTLASGAFALTLVTAPGALAACGSINAPRAQPSGLHLQYDNARPLPAALLKAGNDYSDDASIVGMWHVVFTGQTMNGGAYNLPEPFDNSVVVWHSDGTEIMNSSRPAQDGNFCMGVCSRQGGWSISSITFPGKAMIQPATQRVGHSSWSKSFSARTGFTIRESSPSMRTIPAEIPRWRLRAH
jgi:hypothetical protein